MSIRRKRRSIFDLADEHFEEMEDWAERFGEILEQPSWNQKACTIEPLRNIRVTPVEVVLTVDLPHTEEDNIEIKFTGDNVIEVLAKMKKIVKFSDFGITHREAEFRELHCRTRFPAPVQVDKMKTRFKKGILEIRIPRKKRHISE